VNPGRKTLSFAQWPLACYSTGKQGASLKVHHYRGRLLRHDRLVTTPQEVMPVMRCRPVHSLPNQYTSRRLGPEREGGPAFALVMALWWACQDLNLGPHPYQGSAPGLVSPGWHLRPGRTMYRWRPLETARNPRLRWHVDPTWTRHARSRGQRRSASRTLPGKETPAGCPRQASPARAIALVGGALAGSGPGTSPCIGGLSVASGMVVPQGCTCSNRTEDGGWFGRHGRPDHFLIRHFRGMRSSS
jgi:hypothetical protein